MLSPPWSCPGQGTPLPDFPHLPSIEVCARPSPKSCVPGNYRQARLKAPWKLRTWPETSSVVDMDSTMFRMPPLPERGWLLLERMPPLPEEIGRLLLSLFSISCALSFIGRSLACIIRP